MVKNEIAIVRCRRLIEEALQWGDPLGWTNEDFEVLSERIFERTEVRLSVSTLKRIWGKVRYESSPTAGTLNALARFAGFEGWRAFVAGLEGEAGAFTGELGDGGGVGVSESNGGSAGVPVMEGVGARDPGRKRRRWLWPVAIAILGSGVTGGLVGLRKQSDLSAVRFETRTVTDELPNSVVFHYDVRSLRPRKVMIQQNWDTTRREEVDPGLTEHTSLYMYPGHFNARLIVDGVEVRKSEVFIKTKGWKGIVERKPQPVYLSAADIRKDSGVLGVDAELLAARTGERLFNGVVFDLSDVRDFPQVPADHFEFRASLRNVSTVEQCLLRKIRVVILGMGTAIMIPLVDKGGISDIGVMTGDRYISGRDHDLSAFGCDFSRWQELLCKVSDGHLYIVLNGRQILDVEHPRSIGQIKGIRFEFEGAGGVREVKLSGAGDVLDLFNHP